MRLWKQPSRSITYTYYTFAFAFMEFCYSMILYFWYSLGKTKRLGGLLSYIMKSRILYFCYFSCLNIHLTISIACRFVLSTIFSRDSFISFRPKDLKEKMCTQIFLVHFNSLLRIRTMISFLNTRHIFLSTHHTMEFQKLDPEASHSSKFSFPWPYLHVWWSL